jgi:hypothetical protein
MGNTLPTPSGTCLPRPKDPEVTRRLTEAGVKFNLEGTSVMVPVELPDGWGVFIESNQGDLIDACLCDDSGRVVADIQWTSKGAYDNYAYLRLPYGTPRQLDTEIVHNLGGMYVVRTKFQNTALRNYVHKINQYYGLQPYGETDQDAFDREYNELKALQPTLDPAGKYPFERLSPDSRATGVGGAISALAISRRDVYTLPEPDVWKKPLPAAAAVATAVATPAAGAP